MAAARLQSVILCGPGDTNKASGVDSQESCGRAWLWWGDQDGGSPVGTYPLAVKAASFPRQCHEPVLSYWRC